MAPHKKMMLKADINRIYDEEYSRYYSNIYDLAPYNVGERIGQLVFLNFPKVELERVEELSETVRGECGFGSSGK